MEKRNDMITTRSAADPVFKLGDVELGRKGKKPEIETLWCIFGVVPSAELPARAV